MKNLQELLADKYPMETEISHIQREAFTAGYHAATEPEYDCPKVLAECRKMISEGRSLSAIRLYKDTMGCSLTDAKAILNL